METETESLLKESSIDSTVATKNPLGLAETRNIIDHYHYWKHEAILTDLDKKRHNFTVVCCNLGNDFNIATVIRNANAFLAKEVWIYGNKQWDRRGAVGTHQYSHIKHFKTLKELHEAMDGVVDSVTVAIDNVRDAEPIDGFKWDKCKHYFIIMGQEQIGIPQEVLDISEHCLYIRQYGSVRSLNVGTASGIVMQDYCTKTQR
jgi:tRNA G18 (ribose-2'-O)-methylase SpoU